MLKLLALDAGPSAQWPSRPEPEHPYWWLREPAAYDSGALDPFGVPRLLARVEREDGTVALWLEDGGDPPAAWTPATLAAAAERLGRAHAALHGFDAPWLGHGFLGTYLRLHGLEDDSAPLDALPQTLCHNDFHPANVLESGLVVDWAYCSAGPVGVDAGVLVVDGLADGAYPPGQADDVADAVYAGYVRGLGLDDERVRAGFLAGVRRLRWLTRGRSAARDATIDLIERLASDR